MAVGEEEEKEDGVQVDELRRLTSTSEVEVVASNNVRRQHKDRS